MTLVLRAFNWAKITKSDSEWLSCKQVLRVCDMVAKVTRARGLGLIGPQSTATSFAQELTDGVFFLFILLTVVNADDWLFHYCFLFHIFRWLHFDEWLELTCFSRNVFKPSPETSKPVSIASYEKYRGQILIRFKISKRSEKYHLTVIHTGDQIWPHYSVSWKICVNSRSQVFAQKTIYNIYIYIDR